jgi:hypothetical protein
MLKAEQVVEEVCQQGPSCKFRSLLPSRPGRRRAGRTRIVRRIHREEEEEQAEAAEEVGSNDLGGPGQDKNKMDKFRL